MSERDEKIVVDLERRGTGGSGRDVAGGTASAIVWKD
jgi:hypothetical protein